ncbi:MAG: hypothetical protein AB4290_28255 [Spirulina sp.]
MSSQSVKSKLKHFPHLFAVNVEAIAGHSIRILDDWEDPGVWCCRMV